MTLRTVWGEADRQDMVLLPVAFIAKKTIRNAYAHIVCIHVYVKMRIVNIKGEIAVMGHTRHYQRLTRHRHTAPGTKNLVHLPNEFVDVGFPVAVVATLNVMLELACPPAASGV